jgi:hypothetical protein
MREEGRVFGQLDAESGKGSGVLLVEQENYRVHFPWQVTKSK